MIHLQGLTKYRERGEREQKIQTELCFCASSIFHFLYGLCGQVLETENINLSSIYMNFYIKRLLWSRRKLI